MKVYTVHDAAALAYLQPFFARADGEAVRMFMDAANDPKHMFSKSGKDFTLFAIGEFDELIGELRPLLPHRPLGKAIDFVEKRD